ncbi:unnamed protein product, partial [Prorocentrum cordatum]
MFVAQSFAAPDHDIGMKWAVRTAREMHSKGVGLNLKDGTSSVMLQCCIDYFVHAMPFIPRHTGFVEVFSGKGGTTERVRSKQIRAFAVDRTLKTDGSHDVCTAVGLLYVLWLLGTLRVGSFAHLAPECSTWIGLARAHTRRRRGDTEGDVSREKVLEANHVAAFTSLRSYVMVLAAVRGFYVSVEQPAHSLLFHDPSMVDAIKNVSAKKMFLWMGGWGGNSLKPTEIYYTCPAERFSVLHKSFKEAAAVQGKGKGKASASTDSRVVIRQKKSARTSGKGWKTGEWITGKKAELKQTQEYPDNFCAAFADLIESVFDAPGT